MRIPALGASLLAVCLAVPGTAFGAGSDEPPRPPPAPKPKPEPKPDPKPDPKSETKAVPTSAVDADYEAGKAAVAASDWAGAIVLMTRAAARDPDNANIQNYLGYAKRNNGDWENGIKHYRTALRLNPQHRGANEYLGHAYLLRGNMQLAQAQLTKLERICGRGCEEYASLSRAVDEHRSRPR